jgi:XTP/dITP diphosphohydrolase
VVAWSPRVAPGLLSWPAWAVLRDSRVYVHPGEHELAGPLTEAGIVLVGRAGSDEDVARELLAEAVTSPVVWLTDASGDANLMRALATATVQWPGPGGPPDIEVIPGSYDLPGARLYDVVTVMDRLRSPGGCPWDAEQTHGSLLPHLLEEAYEAADAVETGDRAALREELGDVLLQVVFHARLAAEHTEEPWSIDDVAGDLVTKLVRRHPHVFAETTADTPADVERNWDQIKAVEKGRRSAVDGVPLGQPALSLAAALAHRTARAGVTVPPLSEIREPKQFDEASVGELLLAVAARSRAAGVDPELALRAAARRYRAAVQAAEGAPAATG